MFHGLAAISFALIDSLARFLRLLKRPKQSNMVISRIADTQIASSLDFMLAVAVRTAAYIVHRLLVIFSQ